MSPNRVQQELDPEWVRAGATLKALREGRGLTVTEFAAKVPCSYGYLSNIEAGRKRLTPKLAVRFAALLAVPTAALLSPEHFAADEVSA
jgi:transcriptional regulator with XRE-family HTH domain